MVPGSSGDTTKMLAFSLKEYYSCVHMRVRACARACARACDAVHMEVREQHGVLVLTFYPV